jgi:hypothetical protein
MIHEGCDAPAFWRIPKTLDGPLNLAQVIVLLELVTDLPRQAGLVRILPESEDHVQQLRDAVYARME